MWMKISTMILKMKTSILTMILNAGKASPEEADDAEETETGEDTLDADAHEGKED